MFSAPGVPHPKLRLGELAASSPPPSHSAPTARASTLPACSGDHAPALKARHISGRRPRGVAPENPRAEGPTPAPTAQVFFAKNLSKFACQAPISTKYLFSPSKSTTYSKKIVGMGVILNPLYWK